MTRDGDHLSWRAVGILVGVCVIALAVSVPLAMRAGSTRPATGTQPPLILVGVTTQRVAWDDVGSDAVWRGDDDPDNRHRELQAEFRGQSLASLLGLVDDEHPATLNLEKAQAGYDIVLTAADGYSATVKSQDVLADTTWIIAKLKDGEPLPKKEGPYRDVGDFVGFLAGPSVKMLERIELVF